MSKKLYILVLLCSYFWLAEQHQVGPITCGPRPQALYCYPEPFDYVTVLEETDKNTQCTSPTLQNIIQAVGPGFAFYPDLGFRIVKRNESHVSIQQLKAIGIPANCTTIDGTPKVLPTRVCYVRYPLLSFTNNRIRAPAIISVKAGTVIQSCILNGDTHSECDYRTPFSSVQYRGETYAIFIFPSNFFNDREGLRIQPLSGETINTRNDIILNVTIPNIYEHKAPGNMATCQLLHLPTKEINAETCNIGRIIQTNLMPNSGNLQNALYFRLKNKTDGGHTPTTYTIITSSGNETSYDFSPCNLEINEITIFRRKSNFLGSLIINNPIQNNTSMIKNLTSRCHNNTEINGHHVKVLDNGTSFSCLEGCTFGTNETLELWYENTHSIWYGCNSTLNPSYTKSGTQSANETTFHQIELAIIITVAFLIGGAAIATLTWIISKRVKAFSSLSGIIQETGDQTILNFLLPNGRQIPMGITAVSTRLQYEQTLDYFTCDYRINMPTPRVLCSDISSQASYCQGQAEPAYSIPNPVEKQCRRFSDIFGCAFGACKYGCWTIFNTYLGWAASVPGFNCENDKAGIYNIIPNNFEVIIGIHWENETHYATINAFVRTTTTINFRNGTQKVNISLGPPSTIPSPLPNRVLVYPVQGGGKVYNTPVPPFGEGRAGVIGDTAFRDEGNYSDWYSHSDLRILEPTWANAYRYEAKAPGFSRWKREKDIFGTVNQLGCNITTMNGRIYAKDCDIGFIPFSVTANLSIFETVQIHEQPKLLTCTGEGKRDTENSIIINVTYQAEEAFFCGLQSTELRFARPIAQILVGEGNLTFNASIQSREIGIRRINITICQTNVTCTVNLTQLKFEAEIQTMTNQSDGNVISEAVGYHFGLSVGWTIGITVIIIAAAAIAGLILYCYCTRYSRAAPMNSIQEIKKKKAITKIRYVSKRAEA